MRILITSGGTKIPIDRVRHISNMSSGNFASKIALEALKKGHNVDFFYAKHSKTPFSVNVNLYDDNNFGAGSESYFKTLSEIKRVKLNVSIYGKSYSETTYDNFDSYLLGLEALIRKTSPEVIILAAAVSDYGVENYVSGKIRSKEAEMSIQLKVLPKVISKVLDWAPKAYLVGFKLLVDSTDEELIAAATKSILDNGCDMVVANDLRDIKNNEHRLIIVKPGYYAMPYNQTSDKNWLARVVIEEATEKGARR